MKKLLAFCALCVCASTVFGQSSATTMIKDVYGESHYSEMLTSNSGKLELLEKYALHGFHVVASEDKYDSFPELTEVALRSKVTSTVSVQSFLQAYNSGSFNPLMYSFFPGSEAQVFRLQGTDWVILIDNQETILAH